MKCLADALGEFCENFFVGYKLSISSGDGLVSVGRVVRSGQEEIEFQIEDSTGFEDRKIHTIRLLSDQPSPIVAIRWVLGLTQSDQLPPIDLRLGTTKGTNALLTRTGAKTALITNVGFADAVQIGDQRRPDLFDLEIKKPKSLQTNVFEVSGRIDSNGKEIKPLDEGEVNGVLKRLVDLEVKSLAICLLNSFANDKHEQAIGEIAEQFPFENISLSSRVSPLINYQKRANTAIVDAYLNPILKDYVQNIENYLGIDGRLLLMTSGGALVDKDSFSGKDSLLSGPAGGVVGFAASAKRAGFDKAIGFDMGGTSTDVSRLDGRVALKNETEKFGYQLQTPSMEIETVAAGGGSICRFDGWRLLVGPESAGADPGPACYGAGGPVTVTDCNVWLGRIDPNRFPVPLDQSALRSGLEEIAKQIEQSGKPKPELDQLALSFLQIANSHMATAIKTVTTRLGRNPADFSLVAFGGAAAQNACGVAEMLGMKRILLNENAGILSAVGMGEASKGFQLVRPVNKKWKNSEVAPLKDLLSSLKKEALAEVGEGEGSGGSVETRFRVELGIVNTQQVLTVEFHELPDQGFEVWLREQYWQQYESCYGYRLPRELEVLTARVVVEVSVGMNPGESGQTLRSSGSEATQERFVELSTLYSKREPICGPVVLTHDLTTVWLDSQWQAQATTDGQVLLTKIDGQVKVGEGQEQTENTSKDRLELQLELFHHRITEIATQMGLALEANCISVNVKERLDFSCAVFDASANLIVNAPHIPVHLGAMSQSVREVIEGGFNIQDGDCYITNDPFCGGSHLPDVTLISPFFYRGINGNVSEMPDFWVACRAHHAEIGGLTPGSMPPFSKNLEEEGVLISLQKIVDKGVPDFQRLEQILREATYPSRNIEENIQDIQAQVSANQMGLRLLQDYCRSEGLDFVKEYAGHILAASAAQAKQKLQQLGNNRKAFVDRLDCGLEIALTATFHNQHLCLDFSGTDLPAGNNFNANPSIVQSAVLYCLRSMISQDIPLNQGLLDAVTVKLPECFLNPVSKQNREKLTGEQLPAVVGGNVETSQRLVDVIFGALEVCAASQGTMNNFLFGDSTFGFYETIGGGVGATENSSGADAIHSHMTNTRLTDPEILEQRYPVRLNEFSIRKGSGGKGEFPGGCGMVRRFEFLKPLTVSLVTNRRSSQPYGMNGGEAGQAGENWLVDNSGRREELPSSCQVEVQAGQQVEIRTPGGGGYGRLEA